MNASLSLLVLAATPSFVPRALAAPSVVKRAAVISTVAGNYAIGGRYAGDGGSATAASLNGPVCVALDQAGNLYIADFLNHAIRKVTAATGVMTTVAGTGTGGYNGDGILAVNAELNYPSGVVVDDAGDLYIADAANQRVREVSASTGIITTVAGNGIQGFSGNNGPATNAEFNGPQAVILDRAGNLYISDTNNSRVWKVTAATGVISAVAGTGVSGYSGDTGPALDAELAGPVGLALDTIGNLYIADSNNQRIRMVSANTQTITTVAGNGTFGYTGDNGLATSAEMEAPQDVKVDSSGNLYIADFVNNVVRRVAASTGTITTLAGDGNGNYSGDNGLAANAELSRVASVALDSVGNLYIADDNNNVIRKVLTTTGNIFFPTTAVSSTSAAVTLPLLVFGNNPMTWTGLSVPASQGGVQEYTVTGNSCTLHTPLAGGTICNVTLTFSPGYPGLRSLSLVMATSTGTYYFGLSGTGLGPQIGFTPALITTVAGTGNYGYTGDGGPATTAKLTYPIDVKADAQGNLYIADNGNNAIRKVDPLTGNISTLAGASTSTTFLPYGLMVDGNRHLLFTSYSYGYVGQINLGGGGFSVLAGTPNNDGYAGDGAAAASAFLDLPEGIAVDAPGNIYFADRQNDEVRKIDAVSGLIQSIAGAHGNSTDTGDGGLATSAFVGRPTGVALDTESNVYFSDENDSVVRKVNAATGIITTVAGSNSDYGNSGDGAPATNAQLGSPEGVAVDAAGNIYFSDTDYSVIRKVNSATGIIQKIAGLAGGGIHSWATADRQP